MANAELLMKGSWLRGRLLFLGSVNRYLCICMKTVGLYTLGCKLNYSETSTLRSQFEEHDFSQVEFHQPADVYVINTCSVTDNADKKCRKVVREALLTNPKAYIVVVGCYAQLKPKEIAEIPGVDLVLGASEKFRLFEHVSGFVKEG